MSSSLKAQLGTVEAVGEVPAEGQVVLPGVPVLMRTLLALELLWQREVLDLRAATAVIAEDPGALLQLFRAAAEEGEATDRLETCLACVAPEDLLARLALARVDRERQHRVTFFAEHAASVARRSVAVAEVLNLPSELARQVGLLHELGRLPALLGWAGAADRSEAAWCQRLAAGYGLPAPLSEALAGVHAAGAGSLWAAVVRTAHELPAGVPARAHQGRG